MIQYTRLDSVESTASEGGSRSLGITTDIVSAPDVDLKRLDALSRRFSLQNTARTLLPDHRISICLRTASAPVVDVLHHSEHKSASLSGLMVCASVHVCPVCGAKIGARRAEEIEQGVVSWLDRGGSVVMVTFTLQHAAGDPLSGVAGVLGEAYRKMRSARSWSGFVDRFGLVGSITAREYTYGVSGWHPHLHALLFVKPLTRSGPLAMQEYLSGAWSHAVERLGRYAHPQIGVNVRLAKNGGLAEYVGKVGKSWTVGDELAKANSKTARRGGVTPPQLLHAASFGDSESAGLFVEYASWTYRKNQIVWSPGLRQLLELEQEKTDDQVAEEITADGELIAALWLHQWRQVLAHDARADLLNAARSGDVGLVAEVLTKIGVELDYGLTAERLAAYCAQGPA